MLTANTFAQCLLILKNFRFCGGKGYQKSLFLKKTHWFSDSYGTVLSIAVNITKVWTLQKCAYRRWCHNIGYWSCRYYICCAKAANSPTDSRRFLLLVLFFFLIQKFWWYFYFIIPCNQSVLLKLSATSELPP